ncbi:hypothetical protein HPB51_019072 [Rhipicephalus microplus]|uniref:Uncharacterized protein n=1 Tax=Rhipicephalus microplus TaxID=6941 RepID=A0A9J6D6S8_RHIMP|nr:hypothetical protein HPB51_019072 [Rhipicephalus microplus]
MDQLQIDHDTVSRDAIGAQSHADECASWQAAESTKKRKQEALERRRGSAGLQDQVKTGTPTFKKLPKLPPLPKDDYKIVIRPNQGLPLRNILTPTLAQAIIEACQAGIRDDHFILRINPGSNIAILSTKYEEVADKVRLIRALVLNGRAHAVRAYAANGDDTLRGVIHGVPMNTSTETLMAHLRVRTHGVEIITARMIGTTKSAAITFFGPTLPRTVYYYGGELRCYPFRPTIQVCKVCREKGHRADVFPHPDRPICRLCGLTNPTDGHPCSISCASCGEAHPTGDPTCKKRLKPPKPKQPQVQAGHSDKLQQGTSNDPPRTKNLRWFSSEEEENAYKSADDKQRSRSRSRSPGRKPHPPSKKSAPAPTQQNLHRGPPGGGAKGNGGDQGCTQQASSLPDTAKHAAAVRLKQLRGIVGYVPASTAVGHLATICSEIGRQSLFPAVIVAPGGDKIGALIAYGAPFSKRKLHQHRCLSHCSPPESEMVAYRIWSTRGMAADMPFPSGCGFLKATSLFFLMVSSKCAAVQRRMPALFRRTAPLCSTRNPPRKGLMARCTPLPIRGRKEEQARD